MASVQAPKLTESARALMLECERRIDALRADTGFVEQVGRTEELIRMSKDETRNWLYPLMVNEEDEGELLDTQIGMIELKRVMFHAWARAERKKEVEEGSSNAADVSFPWYKNEATEGTSAAEEMAKLDLFAWLKKKEGGDESSATESMAKLRLN